MMTDEKIKNSSELEFAVFCIENVASKLGVNAERVYQAFTEKSDILNGYIVPEYEVDGEELTNRLIGYMKKKNIKFESMKLFLPYYLELFYRERDKEKL